MFFKDHNYFTLLSLAIVRVKIQRNTAVKVESTNIFRFENGWLTDFFYFHKNLTALYGYIEIIETCLMRSNTIKV